MRKKFIVGIAFPDQFQFIDVNKRLKYELPHEEKPDNKPTATLLLFIIWLLLPIVLLGKSFFIQVVQAGYFSKLAEANRIYQKEIPATRGVITDRHGEILVRNIPFFRIKGTDDNFYIVDRKEALKEEAQNKISVNNIETIIGREYLYPLEFTHVLGYMGEINSEELSEKLGEDYKLGDFVGKTGLEKQYEQELNGKSGKELLEVDSSGKVLNTLGKVEAISGQSLKTSLDLNIQKVAYEALLDVVNNERSQAGNLIKGVVIVSQPATGEILALVSVPSFDPNLFFSYKTDKNKNSSEHKLLAIINSTDKPMFNRAIGGIYPPGSTFKLIVASAGLSEGKITKDTLIEDTGVIEIGPYKFPNWLFVKNGGKDGLINIVTAIKRSNDIFFYKVGEYLGLEKLNEWAKKFNLGKTLGIDIPGEEKGLVPSDAWKQKVIGDKWYLGDTYHMAIGQGYLLVTPLQVNNWTNVIANGGNFCQPHIALNFTTQSLQQNVGDKSYCKGLGLKSEYIELIREGVKLACQTGGTGWPLFDFTVSSPREKTPKKINIACKTGTAEFGEKLTSGYAKSHAWFTSYAPSEKPEISVTVLIEGGGEGSDVAAPVAKKIYEEWFKR